MSLSELKSWFSLIQQAPENLRQYLETTFLVLVFLLLLRAILKILFNKEFKELYRVIGVAAGFVLTKLFIIELCKWE